jgi:hypothetical protein
MATTLTLKAFLGVDNDTLSDRVIVLLRLLGRPFGRPIDFGGGELPEAELTAYLRQFSNRARDAAGTAAAPFFELAVVLIRDRNDGTGLSGDLAPILNQLSEEDRSALAARLVRTVEDAKIKFDEKYIQTVAARLNPLPPLTGPALSVYWTLLLSKASSKLPDKSVPVTRSATEDSAFLRGPIYVLASRRPFLFFDTVVPFIFEAVRSQEVDSDEIKDVLSNAAPSAFRALYAGTDSQTKRRRRELSLELLSKHIELLVKDDTYAAIAEVLVAAAAEASSGGLTSARPTSRRMPFFDFSIIEAGFVRGASRACEESLSGDCEELNRILDQEVEPVKEVKRRRQQAIDPILATNMVPYSEGVYTCLI